MTHGLLLRTDVQDAIHAPHINWETCSSGSVYVNAQGRPGNDQSVASTLSVLPNVIEKSVRTVIVHGLAVCCILLQSFHSILPNLGLHPRCRRYTHRNPVRSPYSCDGITFCISLGLLRRNMTWNGLQGFQTPIEPDSFVVDNMGTFGTMHQERNLTCESCHSIMLILPC